jgi:hypothetical protein
VATTASPGTAEFTKLPGDRHPEVSRTLVEPVPQALSLLDQLGLWGNLGVSLLGFTGAIFVLQPGGSGTPELSLAAALTSIVLGGARHARHRARRGAGHQDRSPGHGAAPRAVRRGSVLPADGAERAAVRGLGHLRAGHHRHGRPHRGAVAEVLDLGLANRTFAVHDLAIAVERSTVAWLDLAESGQASADFEAIDALLGGYESVRPLSRAEAAALAEILPVAHLEFALSEVEYFADIVRSAANAELAYDGYLIGHARWFAGPEGSAVLGHLRQRADRKRTS